MSRKTQHETSEALRKLHPYISEDFVQNFAGEVDPHQVEQAFGMRAIEKLAELTKFPDLSKEGRATALRILVAISVTQEEKQNAVPVSQSARAFPAPSMMEHSCTALSTNGSYHGRTE